MEIERQSLILAHDLAGHPAAHINKILNNEARATARSVLANKHFNLYNESKSFLLLLLLFFSSCFSLLLSGHFLGIKLLAFVSAAHCAQCVHKLEARWGNKSC